MRLGGRLHLGSTWVAISVAVGLFSVIFGALWVLGPTGSAVSLLALIPMVLIAVELGPLAGLAASAVGTALLLHWTLAHALPVNAAVGVQALLFLIIPALCALVSRRVRSGPEIGDRFFELSSDLLVVATADGQVLRTNDRWREALGWTADDLAVSRLRELVHPDDLPAARRTLVALRAGSDRKPIVTRVRATDGSWRSLEWSGHLDLRRRVICATARDVTELVAAEQARKAAEQRFRGAFVDSSTGMALVRLAPGRTPDVIETNDQLCELLGIHRDTLVGPLDYAKFLHPDDVADFDRRMRTWGRGRSPSSVWTEVRVVVAPRGEQRWLHVSVSALPAERDGEQLRLVQAIDINERKIGEERLRILADHDPLSSLYNRRRFLADLEREIAQLPASGSSLALLSIDLDGFKAVNDRHGHAAGDQVIATIGAVMRDHLRGHDLAARLGGDEFAVLLRAIGADSAQWVAAELQSAVLVAVERFGLSTPVTMSIGIVPLGPDSHLRGADHADRTAELLALADAAMYRGKQAGGNQLVVHDLPLWPMSQRVR